MKEKILNKINQYKKRKQSCIDLNKETGGQGYNSQIEDYDLLIKQLEWVLELIEEEEKVIKIKKWVNAE